MCRAARFPFCIIGIKHGAPLELPRKSISIGRVLPGEVGRFVGIPDDRHEVWVLEQRDDAALHEASLYGDDAGMHVVRCTCGCCMVVQVDLGHKAPYTHRRVKRGLLQL